MVNYGTTHWVTFGEGPTAVSTEHVSEADKPFTEDDKREQRSALH